MPANNLLRYRKEMGKTRAKVAADLNVDMKTLYRYERGDQCPNVYMALKLSNYYHKPIPDLFPVHQECS